MTLTKFGLGLACCFIVALSLQVHAESEEPRNVPPEICDLAVVADPGSGDVTVTWSGGTAPFTVVRSEVEELRDAKHFEVVAEGLRSRRFVDRRAFNPDGRLYYQVYDSNVVPEVFDFSPDGGVPGAEIRVRGVGFPADCDEITVQVGGVDVPTKLNCCFTGFTFRVPLNSMTGPLIVVTPTGAALAGTVGEESCKGTPRRPRSW
jgi:hypothetical protein